MRNVGGRSAGVRSAVGQAARRTAVDYNYLLAQARIESGLRPNAKARTSSATGLFQFIESTWLATMKRHGPALGYSDVASAIQQSGGEHFVADPAQRRAILNLRKDPQIASMMAAALAHDNRAALAPVLGREPQPSELYMAHFLGAGDATRFLSALDRDPGQSAPQLLPQPASANRSIFYHPSGAPRNLAEVMELMQHKMDKAIAANGPLPAPEPWIEPQLAGLLHDPQLYAYPRQAARSIAQRAEQPGAAGGVAPALEVPALPSLPDPQPLPPMSDLLQKGLSLSQDQLSDSASHQVRRAYSQLKALDL